MTKISGKPEIIKKINTNLVKKAIIENAPITKPQLSKMLNLSLPTINKTVEELLLIGEVRKCENKIEVKGSGKKPVFYEVNGDSITSIIVYFKNNFLYMKEYNILSEIKNEKKYHINKDFEIEKFLNILNKMYNESKNKENIRSISIGIPGEIEKNGCISGAYTLTNFNGINLQKIIEEKYNIEVKIENDVNLIAIGLLEKVPSDIKNLVYLFLGEGIGTGILIDKKLYKGKSNFAGEIGEILLFDGKTIEEKYKLTIESNNKEEIKRIILFILTINISILNPDIIIINSSIYKITKKIFDEILKKLKEKFGENNIPEIYLDEKDLENGIEGTLKMASFKNKDNLSIIDK